MHYVIEGLINAGTTEAGGGVREWVKEVWEGGGGRGGCKKEYGGWKVGEKVGMCGLESLGVGEEGDEGEEGEANAEKSS